MLNIGRYLILFYRCFTFTRSSIILVFGNNDATKQLTKEAWHACLTGHVATSSSGKGKTLQVRDFPSRCLLGKFNW